jgi:peptidyl-prolyl cis-trans isomerase A (cyclophilin A)
MPVTRRFIAGLLAMWGSGLLVGAVAQEAAPAAPPAPDVQTAVAPAAVPPALVNVLVHTTLGDIRLALEKDRAPLTTKNFLRYVDAKRYDGSDFYRAVKLDDEGKYGLVQGGLRGNPKRVFKPIPHESPRATGLSHVSGAISMARADPGTATSDFFIVVGDLVSLDGQSAGDDPGYAVFGHVVDGMDVVRQIMDLPRAIDAGEGAMKGQIIARPVKIQTVRRVD